MAPVPQQLTDLRQGRTGSEKLGGEAVPEDMGAAVCATFDAGAIDALHKGKSLTFPRAVTPTHYISMGTDPDLDDAAKQALREMKRTLKELIAVFVERVGEMAQSAVRSKYWPENWESFFTVATTPLYQSANWTQEWKSPDQKVVFLN